MKGVDNYRMDRVESHHMGSLKRSGNQDLHNNQEYSLG